MQKQLLHTEILRFGVLFFTVIHPVETQSVKKNRITGKFLVELKTEDLPRLT
jgi:hypothetical protein